MTDRELFEMALDVMEAAIKAGDWQVDGACDPDLVLNALRARLTQPEPDDGYCQACDGNHCTAKNGCIALDNPRAQPEPEPVVWKRPVYMVEDGWDEFGFTDSSGDDVPLYAAPPQRKWQGLTDEEILEEYRQSYGDDGNLTDVYFARAIEAKLKEKNNDNIHY